MISHLFAVLPASFLCPTSAFNLLDLLKRKSHLIVQVAFYCLKVIFT